MPFLCALVQSVDCLDWTGLSSLLLDCLLIYEQESY